MARTMENVSALIAELMERLAAQSHQAASQELAALALDSMVQLTEAQAGYCVLRREDTGLELAAITGAGSHSEALVTSPAALENLARLAHPIRIDDEKTAELRQALECLPRLRADVLIPLLAGGQFVGLIALALPETIPGELLSPLERLAAFAAALLLNTLREEERDEALTTLSAALGDLVDVRMGGDTTHSDRVAAYSAMTASQLGWHHDETVNIRRAGHLHDLGKATLADDLLHRKGRLTAEELNTVRAAMVEGAHVLRNVPGLKASALLIRHQGERWDGQGYPDGLAGESIPAGARVLAVAHRFAVALMPRGERGPIVRIGTALGILERETGTAFDPRIVAAFMAAMGRANP